MLELSVKLWVQFKPFAEEKVKNFRIGVRTLRFIKYRLNFVNTNWYCQPISPVHLEMPTMCTVQNHILKYSHGICFSWNWYILINTYGFPHVWVLSGRSIPFSLSFSLSLFNLDTSSVQLLEDYSFILFEVTRNVFSK